MHSGHFFVVGSAGASLRERLMRMFIGFTTKKNIVTEIRKNETRLLMRCPYIICAPRKLKYCPEKSGMFISDPTRGESKSPTIAFTTVPKAAPITTPTARSTTFPRSKNCLNSFTIISQYNTQYIYLHKAYAH